MKALFDTNILIDYLNGIARLTPSANLGAAQAETAVLFQQYRQEHPGAPDAGSRTD